MTEKLTLALAQYATDTAGFAENADKAVRFARKMTQADLLLMPELFLSGYPIDDLLHHPDFIQQNQHALVELAHRLDNIGDDMPAMLMGAPDFPDNQLPCFNALHLLTNGQSQAVYHKYKLPNFGVFDEVRLFQQGAQYGTVIKVQNYNIGLLICEDGWHAEAFASLKQQGAQIVLIANASPFEADKHQTHRLTMFRDFAKSYQLPIIYLNRVGARDDLIFDGASFVMGADGEVILQMPNFTACEALVTIQHSTDNQLMMTAETCPTDNGNPLPLHSRLRYNDAQDNAEQARLHDIYHALLMGLKDYARHNGFHNMVLGLSGGIDSALVACLAADALGAEHVHCLLMPSEFTAQSSIDDALDCATRLGAPHHIVPITPVFTEVLHSISPILGEIKDGLTHENLQARTRGMILMAHSNHTHSLLLATSNKSESACGYSTLYGDMCGGYAPIQDVYKSDVFALCHWRNQHLPDGTLAKMQNPIPANIISKPPTAELRANQKDSDSLPDYAILDDILYHLIEAETPLAEISQKLHAKNIANADELPHKVWTMLQNSEYKRKQAPPGAKISSRAFGTDRRYPLTSYFMKKKL